MNDLEAALAIYDAAYGLDAHDYTYEETTEWADDIGEESAPLIKTAETSTDWEANGWTVISNENGVATLERKDGRFIWQAWMADCGDYRLVHIG